MSAPAQSRVKTWIGTAVVFAAVGGFVYMVANAIMAPSPVQKKSIQQITLLMPPPPPPPIEQPPEPEIEEQVEAPPDQPVEADTPVSADLGVDADGSGAGDGFGLIGKKGGRDFLDGGPFGFYATQVRQVIEDVFADNKKLRHGKYKVVLGIWISTDGRVERTKLMERSGSTELDKLIEIALASIGRISEPPPGDMPQPVRVQVNSRL